MTDYYPIVEVQPDWVLQPEEMGGKRKFWFRQPGEDNPAWLFKFPRRATGEHWAEKIAAEIAEGLDISCARVNLAVFDGVCGSASRSFIMRNQELFPGNRILARHVGDYDPVKRFNQSHHTLENIWLALERVFEEPEGAESAKASFAEYLILDAIIGNTDRHDENWGVARRRIDNGWVGYLAPSFDHASSLGRELEDIRRERLMVNNSVGNYSEKGKGGIYRTGSDKHRPSPLELVRLAAWQYPELLKPALANVERLEEDHCRDILEHIPGGWITDTARRFAVQLINYNCKELKELM